jgi:hypothetical protein
MEVGVPSIRAHRTNIDKFTIGWRVFYVDFREVLKSIMIIADLQGSTL